MNTKALRLSVVGVLMAALLGFWYLNYSAQRQRADKLDDALSTVRRENSELTAQITGLKSTLAAEEKKVKCGTTYCGPSGSCYGIQDGDTLSNIAQRTLGNGRRFPELQALNNIADADQIFAGACICVPGKAKTAEKKIALNASGRLESDVANGASRPVAPIVSTIEIENALLPPTVIQEPSIFVPQRTMKDLPELVQTRLPDFLPGPYVPKAEILSLPSIKAELKFLPDIVEIKVFSALKEETRSIPDSPVKPKSKFQQPTLTIFAVLVPYKPEEKFFPAAFVEQRGQKKFFQAMTLTALDQGTPILGMGPPANTRFAIAVIPETPMIEHTIAVVSIGDDTILPPYVGSTDRTMALITDDTPNIQAILEQLRPHGWQEPDPRLLKKVKYLKRYLGQKPSRLSQVAGFTGYRGLSSLPMLAFNANPILFGTSMGTSAVQSIIQRRISKHRERITIHTENLEYLSRITKQQAEIVKLKAQLKKKHELETSLLLRLAAQSAGQK